MYKGIGRVRVVGEFVVNAELVVRQCGASAVGNAVLYRTYRKSWRVSALRPALKEWVDVGMQ